MMRKPLRWAAVTLVVMLCLFSLTPYFLVFVIPWLLITMSPFMTKPPGFPADAVANHDFKIGTFWQYCRDLPSGRTIVGPRGVMLEYGVRCGAPVGFTYEAAPSLDRPGMRIVGAGVSFSVPPIPPSAWFGPCPYRLSATYQHRAAPMLDAAAKLPELTEAELRDVVELRQNLAAIATRGLRVTGSSGGITFCGADLDGGRRDTRADPLAFSFGLRYWPAHRRSFLGASGAVRDSRRGFPP